MNEEQVEYFRHTNGIMTQIAGVLLPPIGWALDQQVKYMAITYICSTFGVVLLHIVTLLTLGIVLFGGFLSWRVWQQTGKKQVKENPTLARSYFLGVVGMFASLLFTLVIIAQWLPGFFFNPCQREM